MESNPGKIVLEKNKSNPRMIISETGKYLMGIELVNSDKDCSYKDEYSHYQVPSRDLIVVKN